MTKTRRFPAKIDVLGPLDSGDLSVVATLAPSGLYRVECDCRTCEAHETFRVGREVLNSIGSRWARDHKHFA